MSISKEGKTKQKQKQKQKHKKIKVNGNKIEKKINKIPFMKIFSTF